MRETRETINDNLRVKDGETTGEQKIWKTPKLKILPVPAKTQGGSFKSDTDDGFYLAS